MDIFEALKRIEYLGYYDQFLDHSHMYFDNFSPANPGHPDHTKYLLNPDLYASELDKYTPPEDRNVSSIIEDIKLFEIEVIPEIKKLSIIDINREYLNSYLIYVLGQINKLKTEMSLEDTMIQYYVKLLKLDKRLTAKALIEIGIPEQLYFPIDPNNTPKYQYPEDLNEDNRFRTAIYITVLENLINDTLDLFSYNQNSFQLKNFPHNKIYLEDLFKYSGNIDSNLNLFLNLFNNSNPIIPLKWNGYIGDLRSIILLLNNKHLLINLKPKTHWNKCILCFKDRDGNDIPKKELTKGGSTQDYRKILHTIAKMK